MGDPASRVSRVRADAPHRGTLAVPWRLHVTGIEFINDIWLSENGSNLSNKSPDQIDYPHIPENFHGWGRGPYIQGWDWLGKDKPERAVCYVRLKPISMKVRLASLQPAASDRTFTLEVQPSLNGDSKLLTSASLSVKWPAASKEQIVEITTGGALPNEVSRFDLLLIWSLKDLKISDTAGAEKSGVPGVINKSRHTLFCIFDVPRKPEPNPEKGEMWYLDTGLTKQRLDKVTHILGGEKRRFSTDTSDKIDELVWKIHQDINDNQGPPYFYGERAYPIEYTRHLKKGKSPPVIELTDQWVMWAPSPDNYGAPYPHWNFGACITFVQLMKTVLAAIGIYAQRAWVLPKTDLLPDKDDRINLSEDDLVDRPDERLLNIQKHTFIVNKVEFEAVVVLLDKRGPHKETKAESFEACLFFGGRLYPGAFNTMKYPLDVQHKRKGFSSGKEVLKWWTSLPNKGFKRYMLWKAQKPFLLFFDRDGNPLPDPYKPGVENDALPLPK